MDEPIFQSWSHGRVFISLHKTLAIGLLLALTLFPTPAGAAEPSTDHDVVIVGAGAAGLYAAYTLDNLGYSVLILEATDRHGGRVWSDTLGDVGIEHGAEELYGLVPTGYLDALNTLYFDQVTPYIAYNSPVTVIDTGGIKPVAIDANGVYHYAESIIVTVSLGVLKAGIIDFIPDLPAAKLDAIDTIGMGNGMKISLRFSSQIWESKMAAVRKIKIPLTSTARQGTTQSASPRRMPTDLTRGFSQS